MWNLSEGKFPSDVTTTTADEDRLLLEQGILKKIFEEVYETLGMVNESESRADDTGAEILEDDSDSSYRFQETMDSLDQQQEAADALEQINRLTAVLRMKGIVSEAEAEYIKTGKLDKEEFFAEITFEEMEPFLLEMKEQGKYSEDDIGRWKGFLGAE